MISRQRSTMPIRPGTEQSAELVPRRGAMPAGRKQSHSLSITVEGG